MASIWACSCTSDRPHELLRRAASNSRTNLLVDKTGLFGLLFRFPIRVLGKIQLFILGSLIDKGQTCAVTVVVDDIVEMGHINKCSWICS